MNGRYRTRKGGRIDRGTPIHFTFDGLNYDGVAGDTLASALLANGVHFLGRSFKYHRPRGIMTAGAEEPNALVTVSRGRGRTTPNLRATQIELYDGLEAESQNRWPSLRLDIGAINTSFSSLLSAGFYYKTFMGPRALGNWAWTRIFEPVIRRAAGLGEPPLYSDRDRYAQFYDHCDVLIIGAGPAGLAAALSAGESGARVIICDEQSEPGGSLLAERTARIDGMAALVWRDTTLIQLAAMPNVRVMPRTQAFGYYAQNFVGLCESVTDHLAEPDKDLPRERQWQVRAKQVIIATGAIERPLVFPDNDRPGIMLADAARIYCNRYGVKAGERIVVITSHDSAYQAALDLKATDVESVVIADLRAYAESPWLAAARKAKIPVLHGVRIHGTKGKRHIAAVDVTYTDANGMQHRQPLDCDALLMCGGWIPAVHLFSQSRGKLRFDDTLGAFVPGTSVQHERSAGACNAAFSLEAALNEGADAGHSAAAQAGAPHDDDPDSDAVRYTVTHAHAASGAIYLPGDDANTLHGKAFVDFQNDVCAKDIHLAVREGMRSIEHVKRYTTTGMATDQGKTSNMNALSIAAQALSKTIPEVGLTTFRQPYTPVTFGSFAGAARHMLFDPVRRTPMHAWAQANGAIFEDVGQWKRAWYFPRRGETLHAAVLRECQKTRAGVGLFDASTLGKIEVAGPDAAAFLDKIYTNPITSLKPGRCRYGLMLNEQGLIMDDGIIARLEADRFHITTTTGGAARVLAHMEDYVQTEFTGMQAWLTATTEQWAVIAVQGPHARALIAPFVTGMDISAPAMPHMSVREGHIAGIRARIMRVSFTGELGFEINVPAAFGQAIWDMLWTAGQAYDAVVYGTEAMHVMRAEKGFIIVGQDTDGTVTPADAGMAWAIGKNKADFVGKRSLTRPDMLAANRKQLVGLLTGDAQTVLDDGAQITAENNPRAGTHAMGHVTSSYFSPALNRSIALALVEAGQSRMGETVWVPMEKQAIAVTVCDPVFYDPRGERLDV